MKNRKKHYFQIKNADYFIYEDEIELLNNFLDKIRNPDNSQIKGLVRGITETTRHDGIVPDWMKGSKYLKK